MSNIKTKEYIDKAIRKREVREFMLSFFNFKKLIGLGGPNINEYIIYMRNKGCTDIEIWENVQDVLMHQFMRINEPANLKFGNIVNAEFKPDVLYDLDFCCTIKNMRDVVKKFKNNFVMTFALRPIGKNETIDLFFKYREEKLISIIEKLNPFNYLELNSDNGGIYIFKSYKDTSHMCSIAKIK